MQNLIHTLLLSLASLGYVGIALGLMVEVIPSEIVLAYSGFLIAQGKISLPGAIIAGTIGGTIAQLFIYWIGYYGGRPFLEKYGKYLFIHKRHIDVAENWFNRYGSGVIFTARFIPVVRHAISIPAGIARMPIIKFIIYTMCAVIPWSALFISLGIQLGENWSQINQMARPYVQPIMIIASIITLLYVSYSLWKRKRK
ncbi:membrane protein DedA with SNARE-associated domain [Aneurinibacillus soli]|uniref:Inner membrane protein YabI n=1 Tax=Aneurinibacillus soli TaxID=1500254 RepID=A0A0U5BC66_9BACL|nr:DedA family protein [Aneurinibacillus soli]PYE64368.1 membrane protein DedA with SNARE-associated domain [Aneurinibacillus soli]BAU28317.1 Inner membrane protein YabI [Aneurinibacillus soli]